MSTTQSIQMDRQNHDVITRHNEHSSLQHPNPGQITDKQEEEIFHSRRNGWSCPPHWQQLVGWLVLIVLGFFHFTTIVPGIPTLPAQIVAYVVWSCTVLHINIH